ncbi:MAG: YIP1 family protein [Alphaproteobacteria bacterium]|nr:MAG: YIP1 family protein [Alphaproteobacteria bacterium]
MTALLPQRLAGGYRHPRAAFRAERAGDPPESRLLFYVVLACLVIFAARLPVLTRAVPPGLEAAALPTWFGGLFVANVIFAPLMLYGLAALSHLGSRLFGGRGTWKDARLALFWALLLAAPLVVVVNAAETVLGLGGTVVGTVLEVLPLPAFLWFWAVFLDEVEGFGAPFAVCAALLAVPLGMAGLTRLLALIGGASA